MRSKCIKRSTIKGQKLNYGILLDLLKRSSKTRGDFVSDPQVSMIEWLWCNNGLSEKVLYWTCRKLFTLIENYIMEGARLPSPEI